MEVQHHPEVEGKSLKAYVLEGLMIFLAVTMGFFAEGLRENISKKEKEKDYISSLMSDLRQDKFFLSNTISENQKKMIGLDSLLSLSSKNFTEPANRRLLYRYANNSVSFYSAFHSNDATMMQLKNSGGFQYIKRSHVADSIAMYDQEMRNIYAAEAPYSKAINDGMEAMTWVLYFTNNTDGLPLLTQDPQKIQIFFNKISLEQGWTENYLRNLKARVPVTNQLIELLKKEYGIN